MTRTTSILCFAGYALLASMPKWQVLAAKGVHVLLYVLLIELPLVVAKPMGLSVRTVFFEALAFGSSALTLAGTLPTRGSSRRWDSVLDKLIKAGPCLFGVSSVVFGIDHFLVLAFIASLVPAWLPGHLFWAYLTGTAFIAAGMCHRSPYRVTFSLDHLL